MILLHGIVAMFLGIISNVYSGTITPGDDQTVALEKGKEKDFSWTFAPEADERVVGVFLYNGTENDENKLWNIFDTVLPKGEEMFNGRLKVNYDDGKKLTVTIENAKLNDSITILLKGTFFNDKDVALSKKFYSSVTLDVQGGPELYKELDSNYNFSYNTNPSIKLGVAGKPKPSVQFSFDGNTATTVGVPVANEFQQYEFDLKLPQLTGIHCGMILSYTATSTLQNSSPVTGNTTIFVDDFPLDVTIDSFSYDEKIPIIKWQPVKSGNCQVKYDVTIANQTTRITKKSVMGTSLQIPEISEPKYVQITAIHGSRRECVTTHYIIPKATTDMTTTSKSNSSQDKKTIIISVVAALVGGIFVGIIITLIIVRLKARKQTRETSNIEDTQSDEKIPSGNYASLNLNETAKQQVQYMHLQNLKKEETNYEIPDIRANPLRTEYEVMSDSK